MSAASRVLRGTLATPTPSNTAFFLCDIQERFRPLIWQYPHVVATANKMVRVLHAVRSPMLGADGPWSARQVRAAGLLNVPVIVTEQHPKALGSTAVELDVSKAVGRFPKTKFSMWIPEVEDLVVNKLKTKAAVLFGIETALDLLRNDIDVFVLADGVSSINRGEIPVALQVRLARGCAQWPPPQQTLTLRMQRLREAGATITTSESILFQMMVDSAHPQFKAVSALVKEAKDATAATVETFSANL
nr:Isochorismatase domain-containing protein 1 [Polyrhizophydium stewartii]